MVSPPVAGKGADAMMTAWAIGGLVVALVALVVVGLFLWGIFTQGQGPWPPWWTQW